MREATTKKRKTVMIPSAVVVSRATGAIKKKFNSRKASQVGVFTAGAKVRPELKNIDVNTAYAAVAGGGLVTLINGIQQGSTPTSMVGRKAILKSIQVRGAVNLTVGFAAAVPDYRFVVIYDREPTGALPAVATILQAAQPNSPLALASSDRFKVLLDEYTCFGQYQTTATQALSFGAGSYAFDRYRKISLDFIGPSAAGAIAGISTGAVYVLEIAGGTNLASTWYTRMRYQDA